MKFFLPNHEPCDLEGALVSRTSKTVELDLTDYPLLAEGDATLFNKFKTAFEREFPELEKKMVVEFTPSPEKEDMEASSDPALWTVTLKSDVLKAVHDILHYGNPNVALQIELTVCAQWPGYGYGAGGLTLISGFEPKKERNGVACHKCYEKTLVDIQILPTPGYTRNWYVDIKVVGHDFLCLTEAPPRCSDLNRYFLNDKESCDFEITSEDGAVIPCHKMFLSAKSPVFSQMLQDKKFKEARENKMTIDDMSTRGINALLQYIYYYDFRQALVSCDVALELLKAADKYDIHDVWKAPGKEDTRDLWNAVAKILMKQPHAWYNVDVALKLSSFAEKCQRAECKALGKKMIQVLAMKTKQLPNSTVYSELFPTAASRNMFMLALEEAKPANN